MPLMLVLLRVLGDDSVVKSFGYSSKGMEYSLTTKSSYPQTLVTPAPGKLSSYFSRHLHMWQACTYTYRGMCVYTHKNKFLMLKYLKYKPRQKR